MMINFCCVQVFGHPEPPTHGFSEGYGGAIYAGDFEKARITNCIFVGNKDNTGAGQSAQYYLQSGQPTNINYSCIQGWDGQWGGVGNFDEDPMFVDSGYWDPNETPILQAHWYTRLSN